MGVDRPRGFVKEIIIEQVIIIITTVISSPIIAIMVTISIVITLCKFCGSSIGASSLLHSPCRSSHV